MLRWLRSDVRENGLMLLHFFKKMEFSLSYGAFAFHLLSLVLTTILPVVTLPILVDMTMNFSAAEFMNAMYYSIVLGCIAAFIPALIYARRISVLNSVWALVYSFYSMVLLMWIPVYAFFTARNSNWLTRELKEEVKTQNNSSQCKI